jgi:hypothetical protein
VDAPLVRAFLDALPEIPPTQQGLGRVRRCLEALQDPDVRYLVATLVGPGAPVVARLAAAVLTAAGARTATLGRSLEDTVVDGAAIDDGLLATAGTVVASAALELHAADASFGELTRREGIVLVALTAFAEASQRVALLLDEDVRPLDPAHAPRADVVVVTRVADAELDRAVSLMSGGRPAVAASLDDPARRRIEDWATATGTPLLLGDRDHAVRERGGRLEFSVRGEPYVTFDPLPRVEPWQLGCGIAAALALGVMGIRMREDWVVAGLDALRGAPERVAS